MPINIGDPVDYHGGKGVVCCIKDFSDLACVQFEDGDCQCVPREALQPIANTTAVCTPDCANKCNG